MNHQENFNRNYLETHCWQYEMRKRNYNQDLIESGITKEDAFHLRVSDFEFEYIDKTNITKCGEIKRFIQRHEWLGKMPTRPTHRFIATYKGKLAGVVILATPNSFSNLLGKDNRHLEKLISRGACISWSPKNLASSLIMYSIRWMVKNTSFRFFTAYSDTEARELGTIYQACNFTYLGQNSGAKKEFFDPQDIKRNWFSDRQFRKTSQIKRYAKELKLEWEKNWSIQDKILWDQIPIRFANAIKDKAKQHKERCKVRCLHPKHKYVSILGATRMETKKLKTIFETRNPHLTNIPYPKIRGPYIDTAANFQNKQEIILTEVPEISRPHGQGEENQSIPQTQFLTIKEVAQMIRVSQWSIYHMIKNNKEFPYLNVGVKKKFVIDREKLAIWMKSRTNEKAAG